MKLAPEPPSAADIDGLLAAIRPKLHRYCARMVGSVIDGEDVLQDALIKAVEAFPAAGPIGNPEGWLFRIAHNTALDFLRRRNRQAALKAALYRGRTQLREIAAEPDDAPAPNLSHADRTRLESYVSRFNAHD